MGRKKLGEGCEVLPVVRSLRSYDADAVPRRAKQPTASPNESWHRWRDHCPDTELELALRRFRDLARDRRAFRASNRVAAYDGLAKARKGAKKDRGKSVWYWSFARGCVRSGTLCRRHITNESTALGRATQKVCIMRTEDGEYECTLPDFVK
jgi:hypothetical protein